MQKSYKTQKPGTPFPVIKSIDTAIYYSFTIVALIIKGFLTHKDKPGRIFLSFCPTFLLLQVCNNNLTSARRTVMAKPVTKIGGSFGRRGIFAVENEWREDLETWRTLKETQTKQNWVPKPKWSEDSGWISQICNRRISLLLIQNKSRYKSRRTFFVRSTNNRIASLFRRVIFKPFQA